VNNAHGYGESSCIDVVTGAAAPARRRIPLAVQASLSLLRKWLARRRQRDALTEPDHRLLRHIGASTEEAERERALVRRELHPLWLGYSGF